jgi:hypothetical protein
MVLASLAWLGMRSPVPEPGPATARILEAAVERWWQPDGARREIPKSDWPAELLRLGPEAVFVAPEGVFVRFGSSYVKEWGLFLLPERSAFRPRQDTDPSYRSLRGRVYRYDIKG